MKVDKVEYNLANTKKIEAKDLLLEAEFNPEYYKLKMSGTFECGNSKIVFNVPPLKDMARTCVFYEAKFTSTNLSLKKLIQCFTGNNSVAI